MRKFRITAFLLALCLGVQPRAHGATGNLRQARQALFVTSDLAAARTAAVAVLREDPANLEALFITMEAAALEADTTAELDAALRLCETRVRDPRVTTAAARILQLAANTAEFRALQPRVQALIAANTSEATHLRMALLAAAADGLPGVPLLQVARDAGLLTDWRIAGPFGRFSNVDFDRRWPAELDGASRFAYDGRAVERFRFEDGTVALPDYYHGDGVFYAASTFTAAGAGAFLLRAESSGTLQVFVDGASVLTKDDRFRAAPAVAARVLSLAAGAHRVLVKFIPAATPFRIALLPDFRQQTGAAPEIAFDPERRYVAAAEKYWSGDYSGAIARLEVLRSPASAVGEYLLAQAWSHAAQDAPEQSALLHSVLKLMPTALAAEYELAVRAFADGHVDEALARARRIVAARPGFAAGQELMSQIAIKLNWRAEASQALEARLRLHPSCSALRDAVTFYSAGMQFGQAQEAEVRLPGCAPGSLAYAESLSDAGHHDAAARAAAAVIAEHPLDRGARVMLVRELALAGEAEVARRAAQELAALAPNAEEYRRLAATGISDENTARAADFAGSAFYAPYRRDAFEVLKETAARSFSGGPAVVLLSDRVVRVAPGGAVAIYVHKLTRVLDRDGIQRYGEVALPGNADVLELRTIKPDGSTAEPELTPHKATTSMPALTPGAVIEQEYVQRLPGGLDDDPDASQFVFGSFAAPTVYARFVVLSSEPEAAQVVASGPVPEPQVRRGGDVVARIWERNDVPQSTEEPAMPRRDALPHVRVLPSCTGWAEVRDRDRDRAIAATRIGSRAAHWAASVRGLSDEEKARALFRAIVSRVRPAGAALGSGDALAAEDTLAARSGSRTAALLAVARAAGLRADLLLARDAGTPSPRAAQPGVYTRPLVRFRLTNGEVVVDAETEGMAFGALLPTVARSDALLVPIETDPVLARNAVVSLADVFSTEQSVADGDIVLDDAGDLEARITIRMGATRAAQMRSILAGIAPGQRQHFFEQLALRICPGAGGASGVVRHETDFERPLEIRLTCRAPHYINPAGSSDMDQLVPVLGLSKMYGTGSRRFPLYIDAPLFESATFRLRLPAGIAVARRPADLVLRTEFGEYSAIFRQTADHELEIQRSFHIPVQVVAPARFAAFSQFALQIDDAERQRITLLWERPAAP